MWSPLIFKEFENNLGNVKLYLKNSFNNNNNDDDDEQKSTSSSCASLASPKGRKDAP